MRFLCGTFSVPNCWRAEHSLDSIARHSVARLSQHSNPEFSNNIFDSYSRQLDSFLRGQEAAKPEKYGHKASPPPWVHAHIQPFVLDVRGKAAQAAVELAGWLISHRTQRLLSQRGSTYGEAIALATRALASSLPPCQSCSLPMFWAVDCDSLAMPLLSLHHLPLHTTWLPNQTLRFLIWFW